MRLWLYRILWRLLRRADVGCHRHEVVVHALSGSGAFPPGNVVNQAALLVGMQWFDTFGSVVPSDPAAWAFCVYSKCLENKYVMARLTPLCVADRRNVYYNFRDRAVMLWAV